MGSKWGAINKARAKRRPGSMNKVERTRAELLETLRYAGEIVYWSHEPIKLRLGKASFYTPDFLIVLVDMTIVLEEVKGSRGWKLDDEGRTKWKIAAGMFPFFQFRGALLKSRVWSVEEHEPLVAFPPIATSSAYELEVAQA